MQKNQLDKLVVELKKKFGTKDFTFETIVGYDVLTDAIKQVVESKHIDLIVMGSNGVTGAKEVIFGSNTINVIRKVNSTTLIIPEGFKYKKTEEVLLPLDSFDSMIGSTFSEILKFVKSRMSTLHILRINQNGIIPDVQQRDNDRIKSFSKDLSYSYSIINNVPMHYAVSSFIQTNNVNFMILIEQKELMFERFFMGSSTTKIGNDLQVPLLLFHSR